MCFFQNSAGQDFKVISSDTAKKIMSQREPVLIKALDNNLLVYKATHNKFLIYSNISNYSLLFNNINSLSNLKPMDSYSIGIETDDIRETEQDRIRTIATTVNDYIYDLENKFNLKLNFQDLSILDLLDTKIKSYGIENLSEKDVFAITLYLDEFFRRNTETHWALEKVYTLKTYWIPFIKSNNNEKEYSFFRTIFKSYFDNESGDLNLRLNYLLKLADYNGLVPLTEEHINFLKSFQENKQ